MPKGRLYRASSKQLIIICNGLGDSYTLPVYQQIIHHLQDFDYSVYAFDYPKELPLFDLPSQIKIIKEVANKFSRYPQITLLGGSFGALAAAIVASQIKISNVITVNGFFGFPNLNFSFALRYYLFKLLPHYSHLFKYLSANFHPEKISVPTFVIHGQSDKNVLPAQSQKFYQLLNCPKQLHIIENMDHSLTLPYNITTLCNHIHAWLKY